jgi:hydrophobe/amphiphile efflux-3 (HAE3) family protein
VRRLFATWAGVVRRRPRWLTAAVVVATIALAGGLSRLAFDTSQATMISPASQVYLDNLKYQQSFGGELMVVVLDGDIRQLFTARNRAALAGIERNTMVTGRYHTIIGPDTAMTFADRQVDVAARLVMAAGDPAVVAARAASADARRLAAAGARSFDNPRYVEFLLFDEHGDVRAAQRGAFPDSRHALLVAHLRGNLSLDEQGRAVRDIERAVKTHPLAGIRTLVTGTAALTSEVSDKTKSEMGRSGLFSLLAMVVVLLLVFRARWRLLVLPVIAIAMVWAFGAFGYLGIPLTMVTMSGLPILVGLGVDFAIQVHARYEEEAGKPAATDGDPLTAALTGVGPALVVALVAAAAGFLALRISPVPMVDDFAVMLAVGTGVLLVAVVAFVPLALVWRDRRHGARARASAPRHGMVERSVAALASSTRVRPAAVVGVALVIAVAGLAVTPRIPVETDPEKLVAADSPVLRDLGQLRDVAGSSGDAGFMVEADDVMRPDVLAWMADFERRELASRPTELVSANSIASITAQVTGSTPTPGDVRAVMAAAPAGIRDTFLDARSGRVQMLFAAGHLSLDQLDVLYRGMTADARATAPPGVRVVPSGLALIGIETVNAYTDGRAPMTLAALAAVLLWLLLSLRSVRDALLALLPVVTAVGAASLAVHFAGLQVSLLAALSSPLVIAVCTEFSVLIIERAREEERRGGVTSAQAVTNAASSIGRAFVVSGLTIAAAFAVVGMSGFPLLASFGRIVAVDVVAAMLCALVILPPVLRAAGGRAPSGVVRRVGLDDGREIVVRHATAADAAALGAFYAALPSGDRYRRFFGGGAPPATWLERWVREGERGGAVLLAVADGTVVGEAGYGPPADGAGDFGIAVAREWRGWLGPYLLDALVDVACARGVSALRADVLAENRPMLRLLSSRGDAWLPQDDLRTVRVVIPTSGRAPAWPAGATHPRVAVEVAGGRWRAASAAVDAGAQVMACPRHRARCPVLEGDGEGSCPLIEGADVIVLVEGRDADADGALLDAHARHGDRPVVVDDGHTPVDDLVGRVVDAATR